MSNPSIAADKTPWYQWDTGLTVTVSGGEMDECHFANRKQGTAYVQAVINGVARVPDELLQVAAPIKAYGYVYDGACGQTYVEQSFEVIARNIPSDYTYTKTAQKTIRDAEAARDEAVQAAKDAKASELAADDSAVEASNSAQSAGDSASASATSASNAAKSAGDAAKSASDAKAAAGKAVEDASALLKTYTDNAKTSADNAATSASSAADAASAASGSASAAEQSATDANNAKAAAQTAKDEAATSASNAATSASNAATSATAAEKSASDAAASVGAINVIAPKHTDMPPSQENGIAIGINAVSKGTWSTAIGYFSYADGAGATAIGSQSKATNNFSTAAVNGATTSREREFSVGTPKFTSYVANVTTPSLNYDASNKKYTDDNDAKTLTEAKKYTDANTSNALVGTVSGKLLHVDDAWPGKPLGLTIDGAYKQDGTPSPDSPVPIVVVENPVLRITGRNLVDVQNGTLSDKAIILACSPIPAGATVYVSMEASSNSSSDSTGSAAAGLFNSDLTKGAYSVYPQSIVKGVNRSQLTPSFDATKHLILWGYKKHSPAFEMSNYQLEVGGYHDYRPYTSASIPITLPSEHPYLTALPDGTHDEIVIDKDGNASLVARVLRITVPETDWTIQEQNGGFSLGYINAYQGSNDIKKYLYAASLIGERLESRHDWENAPCFGISDVLWVVPRTNQNDITSDDVAAVATGMIFYAPLATPITYNLGKLDIPSLPETISNVWTDAELATNMSMTYKRDINIAFDNLVQAVVASAAGE